MRIAIYAIAKNEVKHVDAFLKTCRGADIVLVADTGSTDGTVEALQAGGATVIPITIRPWRFDTARNAALALLPTDIDICLALDLDEQLSDGWRESFDKEWKPGATRGHYLYAWSHKADGSPGVEFWTDRFHARHGYLWRHPCHEALYPDRLEEVHVYFKGLRVDHWPDPTKSRGQYMELLEVAAKEDPHSSRNAFYLARERILYRDWAGAEKESRRYLDLPSATWKEQNSLVMGYLAQCRAAVGDRMQATEWLRRATQTTPDRREAWLQLADMLYETGDWAGCYAAASQALSINTGPTASFNDPRATSAHPHDLASFAASRLGKHEVALKHAHDALALSPGDERLARNVEAISKLTTSTPKTPSHQAE
jgi:tetratricopeptide (TPR) repeat protein